MRLGYALITIIAVLVTAGADQQLYCAALPSDNARNLSNSYRLKGSTTLTEKGGRVDWGKNNIIAFDRKGGDGYYDIWTITPGGSNVIFNKVY